MSAVRSGLFSLSGAVYKVLVGLIGMAIFGRIIAVDQHGVYEFVLAIHTVVLPFLDFGLLPAYLKIDKVDEEVDSVFFTLNVFIGILIVGILILIAPLISHWQGLPEMTYYILAYAFIVMVISFGSQPSSQLIKQKRFKEIAIIDIVASSVALLLGVVFALWDWAVWALLLRFIIDVFVKTCMQFLRVRPKYYWVKVETIKKYWESIVFGAEISINRIISGLTNATDRFLIKGFYGQGASTEQFTVLGQYGKAANVTSKADLIRNALTTPALSYLTALGTEHSRKYYFPVTQLFFFATALPILFFVVYGDFFVVLLMGDNWIQAGAFARFLGFYGAGLVLRGLVNIFHINEFLSRRLYRLNLFFFFTLYGMLCSLFFFFGINAQLFVKVLSVYTLAYWLIALLFSLFRFTGNRKACIRTFLNMVIVAGLFISIGLMLRMNIIFLEGLGIHDNIKTLLEAGVVGLVSLIIVIIVFRMIDPRGFKEQFEMVYSRIRPSK